jgi:hemolysin activation/secretion protein
MRLRRSRGKRTGRPCPRRETGPTGLRATARLWLAGASMIGLSAAHAQTPPPQPPAPTREEVTRPLPDRPERGAPRLRIEGGVERAPCALDRPEYRDIRFTLNDVRFDDLRGLSAEALRPAFAPFLGGEHPVAVICEIRDRAATILRDAGYIASVEVPQQRIEDGTVRFQVLMARLVGVRVRGDAGRAERTIAGYLERLAGREVFNRHEAERYLLLAGDLPGYDVRMALRSAGTERGEVIGEVTVVRTPALVDVNVQNYGSREVGRWGALARGQFFGLTGLGDRTTLAFFTTADFDEQQTVQLGHDFRLGAEGLTIGGQFTYAWTRPDLGDPAIDIESRTRFATLEVGYPLIRTQTRSLRAAAGLDLVDQDVDFNGLPLSRDRLRVAFLRMTYDLVEQRGDGRPPGPPAWRAGVRAELRQGLDILGASEGCGANFALCAVPGVVPPSRLEGDPTATILRGEAYFDYRPVERVGLTLRARGQKSGDPLFAFEEFAAGNYTIGRGYDPGTLLGDSGLGVQAELRFGRAAPRARGEIVAEPFLFIDQAWVWNEDLFGPGRRQELTSIGGGVRVAYGDRFRLEALLAAPLDRAGLQAARRDPHLLISFTTRLWPWSS